MGWQAVAAYNRRKALDRTAQCDSDLNHIHTRIDVWTGSGLTMLLDAGGIL